MTSTIPRPPYDPELVPALTAMPLPEPLTMEMVNAVNANPSLLGMPLVEVFIGDRAITHVERQVPGLEPSDPEVALSIFTPKAEATGLRPCVYWMHGGGMVLRGRFLGVTLPLSWMATTDVVVVTVEYRCAPEVQGATIVNDCYTGLCWVSEHAKELGVDLERIMISGGSGARDRKGPKLCAQFLACPMLDDRNITTSSKQYINGGTWSRESNEMAWGQVLGGRAGEDGVSYYASPARAEDLSGLPPAFIDVGSAEVFRDESVSYATKLWAAGVQADLRVYGGAFHAFEAFAPQSRLAIQTDAQRLAWVEGIFGGKNKQ
ncbi:Alpha/Beta hydrolase fold [Hyaloscypha variabilis]